MAIEVELPNGDIAEFPEGMSHDQISSVIRSHIGKSSNRNMKSDDSYLSKAADIAQHFNRAVEGTGLPNAARGFFQSGSDIIRGVGNLIPGVNIPDPRFSDMPIEEVNPALQRLGDIAGRLAGYAPAAIAQEGIQGLNALKSAPKALRRIGAGAGIGAAVSPDSRMGGAVTGGVASALPAISEAIAGIKPLNPVKAIQNRYDTRVQKASNAFDSVAHQAKAAGIDTIPVEKSLLDKIKKIGPKTEKFRSFVDKAATGEYDRVRKLQTELWKRAEKANSSDLLSDQDVGENLLSLRDKINEGFKAHLAKEGHPVLAKDLTNAMDEWRKIQDIYGSHKTISKLVGPLRLEPKNILETLQERSEPMKLIRLHNPEIEQAVKHQKYSSALKKSLQAGSGLTGIEFINHLLGG